jgi:hypothetical protein
MITTCHDARILVGGLEIELNHVKTKRSLSPLIPQSDIPVIPACADHLIDTTFNMRLINASTFRLEDFVGKRIPEYAILSHTWGSDGDDITFAQFNDPKTSSMPGFSKIRLACFQAKLEDLKYVWVDSCCIDKSSSAELSEAINSMFRWYQNAKICYAYLPDVSVTGVTGEQGPPRRRGFEDAKWFTRGWTLQELIAPRKISFFGARWAMLGSKVELEKFISDITGIPSAVLRDVTLLYQYSLADRMSWASGRQTTRVEDRAYSLLGLFDINMPLLYGEGEQAFMRLQHQIIQTTSDESILAWGLPSPTDHLPNPVIDEEVGTGVLEAIFGYSTGNGHIPVFATSPDQFENSKGIVGASHSDHMAEPSRITNRGLEISLYLLQVEFNARNKTGGPATMIFDPTKLQNASTINTIALMPCFQHDRTEFLGFHLQVAPKGGDYIRIKQGTRCFTTVFVTARAASHAKLIRLRVMHNHQSIQNSLTASKFDDGKSGIHVAVDLSHAIKDIGFQSIQIVLLDYFDKTLEHNWDSERRILTRNIRASLVDIAIILIHGSKHCQPICIVLRIGSLFQQYRRPPHRLRSRMPLLKEALLFQVKHLHNDEQQHVLPASLLQDPAREELRIICSHKRAVFFNRTTHTVKLEIGRPSEEAVDAVLL